MARKLIAVLAVSFAFSATPGCSLFDSGNSNYFGDITWKVEYAEWYFGWMEKELTPIVNGLKEIDQDGAKFETMVEAAKTWPRKISYALYSSSRAVDYVAYAAEQLPGKVTGMKSYIESHPLEATTLGESSDKLQTAVGSLTDRLESIKNLAMELGTLWEKHKGTFEAKFGATPDGGSAAPEGVPAEG